MTKQYYQTEIERQLGDTDTYLKLTGNPMLEFKNKLWEVVEKGKSKNILFVKEARYLNPISCCTPFIYFLPKIHKSTTEPPGRPIINGIDSVCARLGQYIDTFLQPLVVKTDAYVRDTKHVIQCLESLENLDQCILATADVGSLYTIIGHHGAVGSVKWALESSNLPNKQKKLLIKCLRFCLKHNYFWYSGDYNLQIRGIAMGARFATSVPNLFLAHWEDVDVPNPRPKELILYKR